MAEHDAVRAQGIFHVYAAGETSVVALRGLDLHVRRGEIVVLIGPSGSGKTTLLRCLAALERPTAGRIHVYGIDLDDAPRRALARHRAEVVGIVGQHYFRSLSPHLSVRELVELKPALLGWPAGRRHARARELLGAVGLADRMDATRISLSGGEQQRVAICAALAARPGLLLADEPTGELDEASGARILSLIRDLAGREGATVVLVSHDPAAKSIADRVLTLRDGRIVSERLEERELTVVDRAGLLRLDPVVRARAGIADRVQQRVNDDQITLRPPEGRRAPAAESEERPAVPTRTAAAAGPPSVALSDASRTYGAGRGVIHAIHELSAQFASGLFHAVVGPSGSGKTTLLHLIAGLERPTSGSVQVLGRALTELSREELAEWRREHVAIVGQTPVLVPFLTVFENVELACRIRETEPREARARAESALAAVRLLERAGQRADTLSGGERQRASIARALAAQPALLLADEPTANLDQASAASVGELLAAAAHERAITVICATHDPILMTAAHRLVQLHDGRLTITPNPDPRPSAS